MASHQSPVEVPEILARIARLTPCWSLDHKCTKSKAHSVFEYKFRPEPLYQCILVCRLWYLTFKPYLWEMMNGSYFRNIPTEVIHRNCIYFRTFDSFRAHPGPYKECTNLLDLSLSQCETYEWGVQLHTQCELVKQNRKLRTLYWHGPNSLMDLDIDSLIPPSSEAAAGQKYGFVHLRKLTLLKWNASAGRITTILHSVADTLTYLSLYSIYGIRSEDLFLRSDDANPETARPHYDQTSPAEQDNKPFLLLPNVVRLGFRINHDESTGLEDLVKACPNVRKLSIILEKDYDINRLAYNIRNYCPKVEALTMKNCEYDEEDLSKILDACRSPPQRGESTEEAHSKYLRGLVRLRARVYALNQNATNNVLEHSNTLVILKLSVNGHYFEVGNLRKILTYCKKLTRLQITGGGNTRLSLLEAHLLGSGPWGCQKLERLRLDLFLIAEAISMDEATTSSITSASTIAPEQNEESDDDMTFKIFREPKAKENETEKQLRTRQEIKALCRAIGPTGMVARFGKKASMGKIVRESFGELQEMERMSSTHPIWGWILISPRGTTNMTMEKVRPQKNTRFLRKLLQHCSTMPSMEMLFWNDLSFRKAKPPCFHG